jgi:hypothetical protein
MSESSDPGEFRPLALEKVLHLALGKLARHHPLRMIAAVTAMKAMKATARQIQPIFFTIGSSSGANGMVLRSWGCD